MQTMAAKNPGMNSESLMATSYSPSLKTSVPLFYFRRVAWRDDREEQSYRYVRWTFFKALAVVIVGVIGVLATLFQ
jgi:hypothetical protein